MGMRLALCQYVAETDNVGANLNKIMAAISHNRADMYIFPEMFLTGPGADHALHSDEIQYAVDKMRLWCMERDMAIVVGVPSDSSDRAESSILFITPNDIMRYDGSYPPHSGIDSEDIAIKYSIPMVCSFKDMTFSVSVCRDLFSPDTYKNCIRSGIDVNICLASVTEEIKQYCDRVLPARSLDNLTYTVFVNGSGMIPGDSTLCGSSRLVGPLGDTLGELEEKEGVLCVYVDKDVIKNARKIRTPI